MITFLRTILIILLVYYGLKFLFKLFAPYIMRYFVKKAGEKFGQTFGANPTRTYENTQSEGSVSFDKRPSSRAENKSKLGDYVDFEEIE